jgi:hypothetical protein
VGEEEKMTLFDHRGHQVARQPDYAMAENRTLRRRWGIDAHRITRGIFQGSMPFKGPSLAKAGFGTLVLAAEEYQPSGRDFPGVKVIHAPLDDHPNQLSADEWAIILRAARFSSSEALRDRRVLITCAMGFNRSGIITAVTLSMATGCSGTEAVQRIRERRPGALRNLSFVRQIQATLG